MKPASWILPSLLLVAVFAPLTFGSVVGTTTCDPAATVTDIKTAKSLTSGEWTCRTVRLHADVTVPASVTFLINHTRLLIDPAPDHTVTLNVLGQLTLRDTDVAPNATVTGHAGRIIFAAGSKGLVDAASFARYEAFQIDSSKVYVHGSSFTDAAADGIRITSGSPAVEAATLQGGITGFRVEGASRPWINDSTVADAAGHAVSAAGTSRPTLVKNALCSGDTAVFVTGSANVSLEKGTFCSAQVQQVRLQSESGSSPKVTLRGVPFDSSKVQRDAKAWLNVSWFATVKVDPSQASPDANAVKIVLRNASGVQLGPLVTRADLFAGPFVVPASSTGPDGGHVYNPWTVVATRNASAGSASASIQSNLEGSDALHVPLVIDNDVDAPVWLDAAPLGQLGLHPGYSNDSRVQLAWAAADDTVNGTHANRGIDYYQVSQSVGSANSIRTAATNSTTLTQLPVGLVRFKVRAIDLAGNAGPYSNEVQVLVDNAKPKITFSSNRTSPLNATSFRQAFNVTIKATDASAGIASLQYRIGTGALQNVPTSLDFTTEGVYNITVVAKDCAGNTNQTTVRYALDTHPPQILASLSPAAPDGRNGWYQHAPKLVASGLDSGAGIQDLRYRYGTGPWQTYTTSSELTQQGDNIVTVQARDRSNNTAQTTLALRLDGQAPNLTATLSGPKGTGSWYKGPVNVSVAVQEAGSGVDALSFRVADGAWTPFASPLHLDFDGAQRYTFRATDRASNPSTDVVLNVAIDGDAPLPAVVRWTVNDTGAIHADWKADPPIDLGSGISSLQVEQADSKGTVARTFSVTSTSTQANVGPYQVGSYRFRLVVTDAAGNSGASAWTSLEVRQSVGGLESVADRQRAADETLITFTPGAGFVPIEVLYYIDDELAAAQTTAPFAITWDTTNVPDGSHVVRIVAKDDAGNQQQEVRTYDVRNDYAHILQDHIVPFGAALTLGVVQVGAAFVTWRKWRVL